MTTYLIGTSGWMYTDWKGEFYPEAINKEEWLEYFSDEFKTVEINNSFYNLPSKKTFRKWRSKSSDNFLFSVKANRYITHMKKLNDPKESLEGLLNNINVLGDKLGPLLFQLPPFWHKDEHKLEEFVKHLPDEQEIAFEFRHDSWYEDSILEILRNNDIALVLHDHADAATPDDILTTNFGYIRFHSPDGRYSTKYTKEQLDEWVERINGLNADRIYCYFNNDNSGYAIQNARQFRGLLTKY